MWIDDWWHGPYYSNANALLKVLSSEWRYHFRWQNIVYEFLVWFNSMHFCYHSVFYDSNHWLCRFQEFCRNRVSIPFIAARDSATRFNFKREREKKLITKSDALWIFAAISLLFLQPTSSSYGAILSPENMHRTRLFQMFSNVWSLPIKNPFVNSLECLLVHSLFVNFWRTCYDYSHLLA